MPEIYDLVPDVDALLALSPEELAIPLFQIARGSVYNDAINPAVITEIRSRVNSSGLPSAFLARAAEVELALKEAWHWIENAGLVVPAAGMNGSNGFRILTRRGKAVTTRTDFEALTRAARFPRELLHPKIRDAVWIELARGNYATAVFIAFRAVEEAVRIACGYDLTVVGTDLVRRAFDATKGPLRNEVQPFPEREALAHLFAGAIGSYKNPHSHRTVTLTDPLEAQEMVMLASHLLRIVESRVCSRSICKKEFS